VTSNFDALNHLTGEGDLRIAFQRIAANLRPGGHLYFDLVTPCPSLGGVTYARRMNTRSRQVTQGIRWDRARKLRKRIVDIDFDALSLIMDYAWPGNVRELENTVEYAAILEKERFLGVGSLPDKLKPGAEPDRSLKRRLEIAERQIILEALLATKGVKTRAATLLGIDRRNFSYFLNKHGIG
jgi:SAM-dependent methyltransferase